MKKRKLRCRQVFCHAYLTYMQATNQAINDQKLITKAQKSPKAKTKNFTKIKKFKNFHKNMHRRAYHFPPPHLNLTMSSLGVDESPPTTKHTKHETKRNTQEY